MSDTISKFESHTNDGDQKNAPNDDVDVNRYNQGKENAHAKWDIKDDRSLANRAAASVAEEKRQDAEDEERNAKPPTAAALEHGNEPSRGAKIDEQIEKEEEELLKNKGKA